MGSELVAVNYQTVLLPTAEWVEEMREFDDQLKHFGLTLREAIETTIRAACHLIGGNITPQDHNCYHQWLTQYLMSLVEAKNNVADTDLIALYADVSTFYYQQLILLFREWNLSKSQIRYLSIVGWAGDDLIVGITY